MKSEVCNQNSTVWVCSAREKFILYAKTDEGGGLYLELAHSVLSIKWLRWGVKHSPKGRKYVQLCSLI